MYNYTAQSCLYCYWLCIFVSNYSVYIYCLRFCILLFGVMHFSSDDMLNLICLTVTFSNISGFAASFITKSISWKITCILWFVINQLENLNTVYLSLDPVCHFASKLTGSGMLLLITLFPLHLHITMLQLQIQIDAFFIFCDVRSEYSGVSRKGEKMC